MKMPPRPFLAGDCLPRNFSWVEVGQLAGCAQPNSERELLALHAVGIRQLVTLSPERPPHQTVTDMKELEHTTVPVEEFCGPTVQQLGQVCLLASAGPALALHCRQGRGRTGTALAVVLMHRQSLTAAEAVARVRAARLGSVETRAQEESLQAFQQALAVNSDLTKW